MLWEVLKIYRILWFCNFSVPATLGKALENLDTVFAALHKSLGTEGSIGHMSLHFQMEHPFPSIPGSL